MAASDMRNRCHVQLLLTWSTDSSCIPGLVAFTRRERVQAGYCSLLLSYLHSIILGYQACWTTIMTV
ncbi:hypothetical protein LAZ67_1003206 [Cordylochernes scorpioides]|uniref:Uncharacterized protein n=1 Tax=Cordylochernes scorpioides TaxID=51811 RepID=A0ABY6JXG0_9ARAC|nr:hypothetical protein LAZ67_1003206 [Cordylochernes scorpioides]